MEDESKSKRNLRIQSLWDTLDVRKEGSIDENALRAGLRKIGHPLMDANEFLQEVLKAVDTNGDGRIQWSEFRTFVEETEKELWSLFKSIDHDNNGKLDKNELYAAFSKAGLAISTTKLNSFFAEIDKNHDGVITFDEWRDFLLFIPTHAPGLKAVLSYYSSTLKINPEGDVLISDDAVEGAGTLNNFVSIFLGQIIRIAKPPKPRPPASKPLTSHDEDDETFAFNQQSIRHQSYAPQEAKGEAVKASEPSRHTLIQSSITAWANWRPALTFAIPDPGYFLAGGIAGIVSRTSTAPLDRLKVYLIAQTGTAQESITAAQKGAPVQAAKKAARPLVDASKALWKAGGIRSLFAGNGLNVVKVMPESALKFGSYEASKRMFAKIEGHNDPQSIHSWSKFVSGGLGGMFSQACVYPLDTLKFRMQCETVEGGAHGNALIKTCARKMWAENGLRTFFRGLPLGMAGMFPYAAVDLGTFEMLKTAITKRNARVYGCHADDAAPGSLTTAVIGAFSGAFGASLVYPLNLLRTRIQTQGTAAHPRTYTGFMDVTRQTIQGEGFRGLFKGLTPNLLKVAPAVSITYVVYEKSKQALGLP